MFDLSVLLVVFAVILVNIGVVNALPTCDSEDEIIFKLSEIGNAHAEVFNGDGGYITEICYDTVFGVSYPGNSRTGNCALGDGLVLKLSDDTNAHAQGPAENGYLTNVCYGDLACRIIADIDEKTDTEGVVVYLSDDTNAHLSLTNEYDKILVCSSGGGVVGARTWRNWKNEIIPSVENPKAGVGWEVYPTYDNAALVDGTGFDIEVIDRDAVFDNPIKTLSGIPARNGNVSALWEITAADLEKAEDVVGEEDYKEFYFEVDNGESGPLEIDPNGGNERPTADILSPNNSCGGSGVYFSGQTLRVIGNCDDRESRPEYVWQITHADGTDLTDETHVGEEFDFELNNRDGQIFIQLECVDGRDPRLSSFDRISILSIGSSAENYPVSCIDNPRHKGIAAGQDVTYDGSNSFAISSLGSGAIDYSLECLGGNCSTIIDGCPNGQSCVTRIPIDDSAEKRETYDDLIFEWLFIGNDGITVFDTEGPTAGKKDGVKFYPLGDSSDNGDREIRLDLSLSTLESVLSLNEFLLTRNGCAGDVYYEFLEGGIVNEHITYSSEYTVYDACYYPVLVGLPSCCPIRLMCQIDPGDDLERYACLECNHWYEGIDESGQTVLNEIERCPNYDDVVGDAAEKRTQCNADMVCNQAYLNHLNDPGLPLGFTNPRCEWVSEGCIFTYDPPGGNTNPGEESLCGQTLVGEDPGCSIEARQRTITVAYTWFTRLIGEDYTADPENAPLTCQGEAEVILDCPRSVVLPFFGLFNLVVSVFIISIIYMFMRYKKYDWKK